MHARAAESERARGQRRTSAGGAGAAAAAPPGAVTQAPADRRDPSERASGQQRTFMLLHDLLQNIARRFNLQRKKERACSGRPRESRASDHCSALCVCSHESCSNGQCGAAPLFNEHHPPHNRACPPDSSSQISQTAPEAPTKLCQTG